MTKIEKIKNQILSTIKTSIPLNARKFRVITDRPLSDIPDIMRALRQLHSDGVIVGKREGVHFQGEYTWGYHYQLSQ